MLLSLRFRQAGCVVILGLLFGPLTPLHAWIATRVVPGIHPQFGAGSFAASKILQELHLPSSPNDLLQFLLQYALKQKLGNTLPLNLNANDAYPTVENGQLPGGSFHGRPLTPTAKNLRMALLPGDYVVPVMAYCTQYSVHRPGQGSAYKLAPVKGTQAEAISTLLWRGTLAGKSPQELQATNWAIQAGVTYDSMPKPYQGLIDQLIPEYRNGLRGNMLDVIQSTYKEVTTDPRKALQTYIKQTYNKTVPMMLLPKISIPAPPLETVLAKMGPPGELLLDAKKQSNIMLTSYTTKERGEQVLFEGQGERLPPEPAGEGPWTVRIPGQVYMRFVIQGGNMQGNNLMQIRVLPNEASAATQGSAHLQLASYNMSASPLPPTSVESLLGVNTPESARNVAGVQSLTSDGVIGYAVGGGGSQALVAVANATSGSLIGMPVQQVAATDPHRTIIGVGEIVRITRDSASGAPSWSVRQPQLGKLYDITSSEVMFRALDLPGEVTISDGSSEIQLTIIAPSSIAWAPVLPPSGGGPTLHLQGKCGVYVEGFYYLGPATVSFSRLRIREKNVPERLTGVFAKYSPKGHCTEDPNDKGFCPATGISTTIQPRYGSKNFGIDGASFWGDRDEVCAAGANGAYTLEIPLVYNALDTNDENWSRPQLDNNTAWTTANRPIDAPLVKQQLTSTDGVLSMQKGDLAPVPSVRKSSPDNVLACKTPNGSTWVVPRKSVPVTASCLDLCTWQGEGQPALCDSAAAH